MAEIIMNRQKEMKELVEIKMSKERLPPNSTHFDVRNSGSKTISAFYKHRHEKSTSTLFHKSQKTL
jgi:hypothetical protein